MKSSKNPTVLRLIGGFKLLKAVLLFALAVGVFSLAGRNIGQTLSELVQQFKIDPDNRYFQALVHRLLRLSPKLPLVALGTCGYGALFAVEGVGLLLGKHWAEWLTLIITGSFLPIEVYELAKHFTAVKTLVLLLNAAIVVYLLIRLKREHRAAHG